jgi:maltooligosyltrehalose trehalohydrolase
LSTELPLGALPRDDGATGFCVWAPAAARVRLCIGGQAESLEMQPTGSGYHALTTSAADGAEYRYDLGGGNVLPDPASRHQPHGVHGPSKVVPTHFEWQVNGWSPPDLDTMLIYELHVGTFTPEGTFDAARERLRTLRGLGVTTIELMPIAQFPGARNWGYDGAYPFAAQHSYGGPEGLKRFVDAAHALDMTVILDVVYNHLGPEGNYLRTYGPYFTDAYVTPWGSALNYDGPDSDHVRRFFVESALQWIDEFRIDALRLDAVHAIFDSTAQPFLRELTAAVHDRAVSLGRTALVIAESDLGDPRLLRPESLGGHGMDAQWLDDFHHALRTLLTAERAGYYEDFGQLSHLSRSLQHGYVYTGQYSRHRKRRHGAPAPDIMPRQFIVYAQNHDQIGNRMVGDRLTTILSPAQLRLMAAAVILSPFTPMLFMGAEYGETSPFPYFVSHSDAALVAAVRSGRRDEFAAFAWQDDPPDPQSEDTFRSAVLDWSARERPGHRQLLALYSRLIRLRLREPALRGGDTRHVAVYDPHGDPSTGDTREGAVVLRRDTEQQSSLLFMNFCDEPVSLTIACNDGRWQRVLDTAHTEWGGAGTGTAEQYAAGGELSLDLSAHAAVLLMRGELTP